MNLCCGCNNNVVEIAINGSTATLPQASLAVSGFNRLVLYSIQIELQSMKRTDHPNEVLMVNFCLFNYIMSLETTAEYLWQTKGNSLSN
jgi:hypothetical protein